MDMTAKEAARLIDISAVRTPHSLADISYVVEVAQKSLLDQNSQRNAER